MCFVVIIKAGYPCNGYRERAHADETLGSMDIYITLDGNQSVMACMWWAFRHWNMAVINI